VRATTINMEMKIAAAQALAALAREDVPDEVAAAYGARPEIRPRLHHPGAVRPAADLGGAAGGREGRDRHRRARKPIVDMEAYAQQLRTRRDPVAGVLSRVHERLRRAPKRVVFAEGEEEQVIRAAAAFVEQGLGSALLVGARTGCARPPRTPASSSTRD
jgi:malate dehydrogenase (oxaloacetate-decarboxylating)(NADP+)